MSIRHSFTKASYVLFPLVFSVLMGCATGVGGTQPDEVETSDPMEAAVTPTETPKAKVTPRPTYTPRSVTRVTTPTASPLPTTLTIMPTATLTSEQKSQNLAELMRTNGGCELPCWWGIVPGETYVEAAREELIMEGFRWGEDNSAGMRVADDFGVFIEFEVGAVVVQSLRVGGDYLTDTEGSLAYSQAFARGWQRYSLEEILNRQGLPTQVLVYSPFRADPGDGPSYHLLVFYEDLGIEIEYTGSAEQLNGGHYRACPDLAQIWEIGLFLYQPGWVDDVVESVLPPDSIDYIAGPETVYELTSWQEATGTSLESFYETYSNPTEDSCFEFSTQQP